MAIEFRRETLVTQIKSPLKKFRKETQEIEVREDPLTGEKVRVNINRTKRLHATRYDFSNFVKLSKRNCPFCPENLEKKTSKFVNGKERISKNNIVIFPNLFPYSSNHAILVMTKKHYLSLNQFTSDLLTKSLEAAKEFFDYNRKKNKKLRYPSINFNYMPPAGASLIHPHMQLLIEPKPLHYVKFLLKKSENFYRKNKKNYWIELIETEKELRERFIGETKYFVFIARYAPKKNDDILIIGKRVTSIFELKKNSIEDLSNGLSLLFKKLHKKLKVNSLNLSSFSAGLNDVKKFYRLNFEIIARNRLQPFYTNDIGFMEYMQREPVAETLPEDTAKSLYFGKL